MPHFASTTQFGLTQALGLISLSSPLHEKALQAMDSAVHELSALVPSPQRLKFHNSYVLRHVEHLPKQVIVQKLSRLPTGLRGTMILCSVGLFQEQAALHRIVDEIGEDIFFLSIPIIQGKELTETHQQYLDAFFQEDFDATSGKPILEGKPMVPRKKIRAYNANMGGGTSDPSGAIQAGRSVHKTDSGYIHASSPHIMDSYGGNPPRFHTTGMLGTIREIEYRQHLDNYFYRTITAFAIAATASAFDAFLMRCKHTCTRLAPSWTVTEMSPNNSFKPNPLRGSA